MIVLNYTIDKPTLIISHKTGIFYGQQTNGCSCEYHDIEGYIVPFYSCRFNGSNYFDSSWWYNQYGYTKNIGKVYKAISETINNITFPLDKEKIILDIDKKLRSGSANGNLEDLKSWELWDDFCGFVEDVYTNFNLKVRQDVRQVEAWIKISCCYGEGVLTWGNCD